MIVYVITCGEYSDYRICAVTLDKMKAEALKKKYDYVDYTGANIEEYDTDDCEKTLFRNNDFFRVTLRKDGSCISVTNQSLSPYSDADDDCEEDFMYDEETGRCFAGVWAEDGTHAVKIAAERRAKYLSEKLGL